MSQVVVNLVLEFLTCVEGNDFALGLEKLRKARLRVGNLESTATRRFKQATVHSSDFTIVNGIQDDLCAVKRLCLLDLTDVHIAVAGSQRRVQPERIALPPNLEVVILEQLEHSPAVVIHMASGSQVAAVCPLFRFVELDTVMPKGIASLGKIMCVDL